MTKLNAYLSLIRPANIITSFADIFAGFGVAAIPIIFNHPELLPNFLMSLCLLLIATAGLYSGGIVLNDIADVELDKIERPERPIPKGIISLRSATLSAISFLVIGIAAAFIASPISGFIAVIILLLILNYNFLSKDSLWLGPLSMALCRCGNLLLGLSISQTHLEIYWVLMFIPLFFISGVTLVSKGEVLGSSRALLIAGLLLYCIALILACALGYFPNYAFYSSLPFYLLFIFFSFFTLFKAILTPSPERVKTAVVAGILSWVILDAGIAAGFAGIWYGVFMVALIIPAMLLSRRFVIS
ncbi:MAG: UbiA-like protein EboC [Gammaproteobacteria bacterium]|nr:UbiA-like protein EboC [Gammaproteobacteria bacterium]